MLDQRPAVRHWLSIVGICGVCAVLPVILVLTTINRHPKFSPIDEAAHFDYVERVYTHGIPDFGDRLLRSTLRELSCRGTRLDGMVVPPCNGKKPFNLYPGGAYQYEAQQPPLYYLVTAPLAFLARHLFRVGKVSSARAVGTIWLVAALFLAWRVSRMLNVPRLPMFGMMLAIATSPMVIYYSSIVSNDAAGLFFGALAAFLGVSAVRTRSFSPWWAFVSALGAALTKTSCALPFGVVGVILIGLCWSSVGRSLDVDRRQQIVERSRKTGLYMLLGAVVGSAVWISYYRAMATLDPKKLPTFDILRTGSVTPWTILGQARSFFSILTDTYTPFAAWNTDAYALIGSMTAFVVIASLGSAAFTKQRAWWTTTGSVLLVSLYLGGVVIGTGIWFSYDVNPGVSARYALPMLPLVGLVVPAGIQRRSGQMVFVGGCVLFAGLSMWMMIRTSLA